ncbi:Aldo/keto reductase [Gonapodya prolifera JEL478]|uniref:Aldo/keto reductase n=1 Tax=Gonapodya prolifera (strain JEL478) TaxID=1344416 RepID=A0A139A7Q4_GONPJ|nr:Aldo/keto reductase [Gonapodya prolifera JEL478]|eukprot:KXS12841.1 Aldo/keto reductase [Gonapodya prolifera JEL478]
MATSKMQYTKMGATGLKVSRLCLGTMTLGSKKALDWALDENESIEMLQLAWELGINFIDTADKYCNSETERVIGHWMKSKNIARSRVVIASKVWFAFDESDLTKEPETGPNLTAYSSNHEGQYQNSWGLSRSHILSAIEGTLERLGTSYVDIYYVHQFDYTTPLEETMEALNDLVRWGKVRYIAASSMWAWQFQKANYIAKSRGWAQFVCMQNLYSLLYREEEREMIPLLKDMGVGMCPWSPLAGGLLAARNRNTARAQNDNYINKKAFPNAQVPGTPDYIAIERVEELANKKGVKMAQISTAWLLSKPFITAPIIGVTKKEQLIDLVNAVNLHLSAEEIAYLEEPYQPKRVVGNQMGP